PLLERICEVVASAHEQGILHRDLKPANVMVLARAGRLLPKLLDFGIGKLIAQAQAEADEPAPSDASAAAAWHGAARPVTQVGIMIGSPPYMAPEQWVRAGDADARADLYALGVLSYEALTGRLPFTGETVLGLARAHAGAPVPPLGRGLPAALDEVFVHALAKRPSDRFASALELAAAFRRAAGLAQEPTRLPQLDDDLREALAAGAPQPLAEAVAQLELSRNAHQALAAVWQGVSVPARRPRPLAPPRPTPP